MAKAIVVKRNESYMVIVQHSDTYWEEYGPYALYSEAKQAMQKLSKEGWS